MDTTTPAPATSTGPLKVAAILGSNREGRFGPVIADWFLDRAAGHPGIDIELIDVARPGSASALLARADAFVVVTPEYNHSFPAPLKHLIDAHFTEWQAKPVAFVSYGGVSGGLRAVEHLRLVFSELHAVPVRDTVSFHHAGALFDDRGRPKDPAPCDAAAKTMLDQLVWWGRSLREARERHPYGG
ncbi:NADPH-dependent FMN reductase [Streptomyces sp. B1I3]|uniref:NADPH-dependent FMN reductase n=1 Tax=Streptomyces sp. B1I3 TaxID=3042264 RepID=UPI0027806F59|nr:NAD(P)H-dependent oxidoreductase [Streptomyces sp. B1I3]MDQ0796489.1 NAD(P)H-dependent FMN reductase [Streptomyces sp. B1I3]